MQLLSIHTIIQTVKPGKAGNKEKGIKPVAPVSKEIPPGMLFDCSDEDAKFFLRVGAAALPEDSKFVPKKEELVPEKTKEPEPNQESSLSEDQSESSAGDSDTTEESEPDLVG